MRTFFHSFLLLIAKSTDRQLAQYLEFLKIENRILRSKLPRRRLTLRDRDANFQILDADRASGRLALSAASIFFAPHRASKIKFGKILKEI